MSEAKKLYTGIIQPTEEDIELFYSNKKEFTNKLKPKENQFVIINKENIFCYQKKEYRRVAYQSISNSLGGGEIKPLDEYQATAVDLLKDKKNKVKLICGKPGAGKDFLMFNTALELVEKGKFDKIVFTRVNVTLKGVPQIGYLPNGVDEKLAWTMAPLYDKVGGEEGIQNLIYQRKLEMAPMVFIKGMSFDRSIVYITEAQNMDVDIAYNLQTRVGRDSEFWLNGDIAQTDLKMFDENSGIRKMLEKYAGDEIFTTTYLPEIYRSDVAKLAEKLYD